MHDNTNRLSEQDKVLALLLLCLSFLSIEPYIIWGKIDFLRFITIIFIIASLSFNRFILNKTSILGFILILYFVLFRLDKFSDIYSYTSFAIFSIPFISNNRQIIFTKIFDWTATIFAILFSIGIPLFFIIKFIDLPSILMAGRNLIMVEQYRNYIFLIEPVQIISLFPRFNSVFDEPGVVGTISTLLLCGYKYQFKNWKPIIILIAGILSFSLFFYISSLILMMLFNYKKNFKYIIVTIILLFLITKIFSDNEVVSNLILERLKISDNNIISGNNRTTDVWDANYDNFLKKGNIYFGESRYDVDKYPYVANYTTFIFQYGIIGGFLILTYYFAQILKYKKNKESFILFICLIMAFYQRPWPFSYYYIILSLAVLAKINYNKEVYE